MGKHARVVGWAAVAAAVVLGVGGAAVGGLRASEAADERLTNGEVDAIVAAAVARANAEVSGLRVSDTGTPRPTKMHIVVADRDGKIRKLYSMSDAWTGSISIAKAKAFTAAAFSSNENALTTRTIGALSQPGGALWQIGNSNQPAGDDHGRDGGVTPQGIIEFPGGLPLYKNGKLVGGIGVSGDGVDQDEDVAEAGSCAFRAPTVLRAAPYTAPAQFTCP